jgi:hypothetical protein
MRQFALMVATLLASCQSTPGIATSTETLVEGVAMGSNTMEPSGQPSPSAAEPSPIATERFIMPSWAEDEELNILLAPAFEGIVFKGIQLINPETNEFFVIPYTGGRGYFWTRDGGSIGLIAQDGNSFRLIKLSDGSVEKHLLNTTQNQFLSDPSGTPRPYHVTAGSFDSDAFTLVRAHIDISPNGRFFVDPRSLYSSVLQVYDSATQKILNVATVAEGEFLSAADWSPVDPFSLLGVTKTWDSSAHFFGYYEKLDNFEFSVYDLEKNVRVLRFDNIPYPEWSPNGDFLLYQPQFPARSGGGYTRNLAPCVFGTLTDTNICYENILVEHIKENYIGLSITSVSWLPDGQSIAYIYFQHHQGSYPSGQDGGLCVLTLATKETDCKIKVLQSHPNYGDTVPIHFLLSPDGRYAALVGDAHGPLSDDASNPVAGILDMETGTFTAMDLGEPHNVIYVSIWRP